jgi:hypothetical protein
MSDLHESQKPSSQLDQFKEDHEPASDLLELPELPDLVDLPDLQEAHNALEKVIEKEPVRDQIVETIGDGLMDLKRKLEVGHHN